MFGSAMLEIAIGTVFVFLAASLSVTAANELCASLFRLRARQLAEGMRRLLDHGPTAGSPLSGALVQHPLIQSLVQRPGRWPSYLPSRTFAMALLDQTGIVRRGDATVDTLRTNIGESALPEPMKRVLFTLLLGVEADVRSTESPVQKLHAAVERWFDDAMDRVGGWYKRKAQYLNLGLSLLIVVATNLDSIDLVRSLATDATLRQAISAQATQIVQSRPAERDHDHNHNHDHDRPRRDGRDEASAPEPPTADGAKAYRDLAGSVRSIGAMGIPIGWAREGSLHLPFTVPGSTRYWTRKALGLLLTALAASLGAPFWFDLLSKIVSIRTAGKTPDEKARSSQPSKQLVEEE
jgi:hypothetical protein